MVYTAYKNPQASLVASFHLLRRKIRLEYYFLNNYSICPDFITILITKRCNFKCKRCSSQSPKYTTNFKQSQQELTTEEIKNLINQVAYFKPVIYFCGGEPTLRQDLFELIKYIKNKNLITAFTTNGSLMNDKVCNEILDSGLDFFSVSIDGHEEYHDRVRGFNGAFNKVTNGLRALVRIKKDRDRILPHIRIASIVDIDKLENSKYVLDLANEIRVDEVAFGNLMFYTKEAEDKQKKFIEEHNTGGEMIGLAIEDDSIFSRDIDKIQDFSNYSKKYSNIPVSFVPDNIDFENYFAARKYPSKKSKCFTPWFSATIMPNGDVVPCQEYVVGNIREEKLLDIWNNEKMKRFRYYRKKGPMPACFRCNEGQDIKFDRE